MTDVAGRDAAESIGATSARVFEGRSQKMPHGRVFGGQVLAQCVMAAGHHRARRQRRRRRPPDPLAARLLHAARRRHAADPLRRRGDARRQLLLDPPGARRAEGRPDHVDGLLLPGAGRRPRPPGPARRRCPVPEELRSLADEFRGVDHPGARHIAESRPIELRPVEGNLFLDAGAEQVATNHVWMRAVDRLPDDPLLHAAVLAYASDYSLLEPVLRRHGLVWTDPRLRVASLDHSMWFHRDARADDWLLYAQESPSAISGRGLAIGHMFSRDGMLVATTAQEGMVRVKQS